MTCCARWGIASISQVKPKHLEMFLIELQTGEDGGAVLARASAARALVAVRGLTRFATDEGLLVDDPGAGVRPPTPGRRLPKALSVDEVLSLLAAVGGPGNDERVGEPLARSVQLRDRALLELLYGTGARISELVSLDVDEVELGTRSIKLCGKGSKQRVVPLGSHAASATKHWLELGRPVVAARAQARVAGGGGGAGVPAARRPSGTRAGGGALLLNQHGARLSRQSAWQVLATAGDRAGLGGRVSPHVLRHCFATHLLDGGADIRVVQELLGHASVTTTQIYTMVTVERLREVYALSHPRAR